MARALALLAACAAGAEAFRVQGTVWDYTSAFFTGTTTAGQTGTKSAVKNWEFSVSNNLNWWTTESSRTFNTAPYSVDFATLNADKVQVSIIELPAAPRITSPRITSPRITTPHVTALRVASADPFRAIYPPLNPPVHGQPFLPRRWGVVWQRGPVEQ